LALLAGISDHSWSIKLTRIAIAAAQTVAEFVQEGGLPLRRTGCGQGEEYMSWDQLEGRWKEFAGSARAHWSKLTDEDWQTISGKKEQLVGGIQRRYGVAKEEAEKQVGEWFDALLDIAAPVKTR
jgi:uncharacterized protein YjbJ (UPF0337 family)